MNEHERSMRPEDIVKWNKRLEGVTFTRRVQETFGMDDSISWTGRQEFSDFEGNTVAINFSRYSDNSVFWEMEWKDMFISAYFDNTTPAVDISHASIRGAISINFDNEITVAGNILDSKFDQMKAQLQKELIGKSIDFEAFSIAFTEPTLWAEPTQSEPIVERIVSACVKSSLPK